MEGQEMNIILYRRDFLSKNPLARAVERTFFSFFWEDDVEVFTDSTRVVISDGEDRVEFRFNPRKWNDKRIQKIGNKLFKGKILRYTLKLKQ